MTDIAREKEQTRAILAGQYSKADARLLREVHKGLQSIPSELPTYRCDPGADAPRLTIRRRSTF